MDMILSNPLKWGRATNRGMAQVMKFKRKTGLGQYFRLSDMFKLLRSHPATVKEEKDRYLAEQWRHKTRTLTMPDKERRQAYLLKGWSFAVSRALLVGGFVMIWKCCAVNDWKIDPALLIGFFTSIAAKLIG